MSNLWISPPKKGLYIPPSFLGSHLDGRFPEFSRCAMFIRCYRAGLTERTLLVMQEPLQRWVELSFSSGSPSPWMIHWPSLQKVAKTKGNKIPSMSPKSRLVKCYSIWPDGFNERTYQKGIKGPKKFEFNGCWKSFLFVKAVNGCWWTILLGEAGKRMERLARISLSLTILEVKNGFIWKAITIRGTQCFNFHDYGMKMMKDIRKNMKKENNL